MTISRRDALRLAIGLPALGACERVGDHVPSPGALTPEAAWPTMHVAPTIPAPPDGWKLEIRAIRGGAVQLSLDDVMRLPKTEQRITFYCVRGWRAVADFTGVRLSELAKLVGSKEHPYVELRSFDAPDDVSRAYWSSWDRQSALHDHTLVAYARNGALLSPAAGAPLRVVSAVKLGYKNVKYLREINFVDRRTGGYRESRGYDWFGGV